jgi:hypothetical protein
VHRTDAECGWTIRNSVGIDERKKRDEQRAERDPAEPADRIIVKRASS